MLMALVFPPGEATVSVIVVDSGVSGNKTDLIFEELTAQRQQLQSNRNWH